MKAFYITYRNGEKNIFHVEERYEILKTIYKGNFKKLFNEILKIQWYEEDGLYEQLLDTGEIIKVNSTEEIR